MKLKVQDIRFLHLDLSNRSGLYFPRCTKPGRSIPSVITIPPRGSLLLLHSTAQGTQMHSTTSTTCLDQFYIVSFQNFSLQNSLLQQHFQWIRGAQVRTQPASTTSSVILGLGSQARLKNKTLPNAFNM